ncbi:MAG: DNA-processing protein DprA [Eubacteriales bacterium]|nr:DNA-processing protein DprA [Eubacteriales bacterium]
MSNSEYEAEKRALFLLNNIPGMSSDILLKMYEYAGSFTECHAAAPAVFYAAGIFKRPDMAEKFEVMKRNENELLKKYEMLQNDGIRLVSILDEEYPERLKNIDARPPLLYVCGKLPDEARPTAGIIGARKCSEYGKSVTLFFAEELSKAGIQVVSGLAYGIDGAAAAGSLRGADESYGVLGCGVNICYPKENWALYNKMKGGAGGILSEFPPDTAPLGYHFTLRNRIIAGLSDVLLVIEAGEKSGTSITVGYALDQGKEIFALPGRITDPLGFGCNRMLKDGANILTSPSDVLEYFGMGDDTVLKMGEKDLGTLSPKEKQVYKALLHKSQHVEAIAAKCKFDLSETMTVLAGLEAKGYAASPHGAYYRKSF